MPFSLYNPPAVHQSEVSSVVEHILHTDGVISSNLILRTNKQGFAVIKSHKTLITAISLGSTQIFVES